MTAEEVSKMEPPVEVWPENWTAFQVFYALDTQWRHGMEGRTGIDYAAIPVTVEMLGLEDVDRQDLFSRIRRMEHAALKQINKER